MKIMAQQFHTFTAKRASENYGGSPHRLHMNPWRASVFRVAADPCNAQNAPRSSGHDDGCSYSIVLVVRFCSFAKCVFWKMGLRITL
jgi:hypothetical protein